MQGYTNQIFRELKYGPAPAHKRVINEWKNGEVRIIKPADPDKLAALRAERKSIRKRRVKAGFSPTNDTVWGTKGL